MQNGRSKIIRRLFIVIIAIFFVRLAYIQVVKHSYYRELASSEHLRKFEINPRRGNIYISDGDGSTPVVLNEVRPTLYADPSGISDKPKLLDSLAKLIKFDRKKTEELFLIPGSRYAELKKKLTASETKIIEKNLESLPGLGLKDETFRVYPEGTLASQILGFVNGQNEGQYGVEGYLNKDLSGEPGLLKAITDVNGIPIDAGDEDTISKPAKDGNDVLLTIDRTIQNFTEKALMDGVRRSGGKRGSAVVMDPNNGKILAMANYPSYDPAKYQSVEDYQRFQNGVVSSAYETGSGVKIFTMSTGLDLGVVSPNTTYYDSGMIKIGDRVIENAGGGGLTRSMSDVIKFSVNTGVVFVLEQLGGGSINDKAKNRLYDYFVNKFGFGSKTGIEQAGESAGSIISPKSSEGNAIRYANMSFGQGMTVTMLQMVSAFSSVMNGGTYYKPMLVEKIGSQTKSKTVLRKNVVSSETTQKIRKMSLGVVEGGGGLIAKRQGYSIGGKTGTAQVLNPDGTYSDTREVGSFIGWGGTNSPRYVIMTRVDEPTIGGYAGTAAAAPIFAEISNKIIDYWEIPPR